MQQDSPSPLFHTKTTTADYIRLVAPILSVPSVRVDDPLSSAAFWSCHVATLPDFEDDKERLVVLALNTKFFVKAFHTVSIGSLNESLAHPREIFRPVIALAAYAFILMHNHPSGDPAPSQADQRLTRRIADGADLLQIRFLDHMIIGDTNRRFSFREAGLL